MTAPLREAEVSGPTYDSPGASAHWSPAGAAVAAGALTERLARLP
jgi:hypothetical protein